jgi:hypothetical protein
MREKAKEDPDYRSRLLKYISSCIVETMPPPLEQADFEDNFPSRSQAAFRPQLDLSCTSFEETMSFLVYCFVKTWNMHSTTHHPTCFKNHPTKCRTRFPRALVDETTMDPDTGIIRLKRDDRWVNPYNPWIMMMLKANHDCQFLFGQGHALAIISYVMKYITKREQALHSRLTIAAAVRKEVIQTHRGAVRRRQGTMKGSSACFWEVDKGQVGKKKVDNNQS